MTTWAFIPARGGSKGIPGKNMKLLAGKPLVHWVLQAAAASKAIDQVVLATDSEELAAVAEAMGGKVQLYWRQAANATDTASTEAVMLEWLDQGQAAPSDTFVLMQATSPFTTANDLDRALQQFREGTEASVLSVATFKRFVWTDQGPSNYDPFHRPRRQDFSGQYIENGAFYINTVAGVRASANRLTKPIGLFEMAEHTALELDEPHDWQLAEALMRQHQPRLLPRTGQIKLVATDLDGCLTDAGMYYTESGDEFKKFNTHDGKGFELLRKAGLTTAIITAEDRKLNQRRAEKMRVDHLHQGVVNKVAVAEKMLAELGLAWENMAYLGDDLNDIALLEKVGFAACPANALPAVRALPGVWQLEKSGGEGALRQLADLLLA